MLSRSLLFVSVECCIIVHFYKKMDSVSGVSLSCTHNVYVFFHLCAVSATLLNIYHNSFYSLSSDWLVFGELCY